MNNNKTKPENAARNTYEIANDTKDSQTSWNEVKAVGKNVVEASSTTYDRNSRFLLFVNNDLKTPQEFDNLVTKRRKHGNMEMCRSDREGGCGTLHSY